MANAVRIVPAALWNHLGHELSVAPPELASLKAMYGRRGTLFEHQTAAQEAMGFRQMTKRQHRSFVDVMRDAGARLSDNDLLLSFARRWLHDHNLLIEHDRALRTQFVAALDLLASDTVPPAWQATAATYGASSISAGGFCSIKRSTK